MMHVFENPDRNFSIDSEREGFEFLKRWLAESQPALPYNEAAKSRIGKAIGDSVLPRHLRPPIRRLPSKRAGLP